MLFLILHYKIISTAALLITFPPLSQTKPVANFFPSRKIFTTGLCFPAHFKMIYHLLWSNYCQAQKQFHTHFNRINSPKHSKYRFMTTWGKFPIYKAEVLTKCAKTSVRINQEEWERMTWIEQRECKVANKGASFSFIMQTLMHLLYKINWGCLDIKGNGYTSKS